MIGFIAGSFFGAFICFVLMAAVRVSHDADEREKKFYDNRAVDKGDELR